MKGTPQEDKPANIYVNIEERIIDTKVTKRMNIGLKLLLVVIKSKNIDKFKTMEVAKTSLQKAFCARCDLKRLLKERKTLLWRQIQSKLKNSIEIGRQFAVEKMNRAKPRIIIYEVPTLEDDQSDDF